MNRTQRLAFVLTGLVLLLCGGVMAWFGFGRGDATLKIMGPGFLVSGAFWLAMALSARRRS